MGDEERCEADLCERIDRVQRLRSGRRLEREELLRLLEANERVGEAMRRTAEAGGRPVGRELSLLGQHEVQERCRDRAEKDQQHALQPASDPAHLDHHRRKDDERRLHGDVPVMDLRQLVREHAFELGGRQQPEQAARDGDRGASRAAAS
jgi:hypothetical protein